MDVALLKLGIMDTHLKNITKDIISKYNAIKLHIYINVNVIWRITLYPALIIIIIINIIFKPRKSKNIITS